MRKQKNYSNFSPYKLIVLMYLLFTNFALAVRSVANTPEEQNALNILGAQGESLCEDYSRAYGACIVLNELSGEGLMGLTGDSPEMRRDCSNKQKLFDKMTISQQQACKTLVADHGAPYLTFSQKQN